MKSQYNSWPCLAIHEKKKAQLVQKNQPNESTVAKPHLATSSIAMIIVQKNTYVHWRQSGVNSAGARRGFSGILLQNT